MIEGLYLKLKLQVKQWRKDGYPSSYSGLATILRHNRDNQKSGFKLREAQVEALEIYWYLRMMEDTTHILDLYKKYFQKKTDLLEALGVHKQETKDFAFNEGMERFWNKIEKDNDFVKEHKLQTLRETISLNYSSYILALAMGAGKTVLIGTIIATEYALALEYPEDDRFVRNALVFAPGKTILGALQEIAQMPYEKILPTRFYKNFAANVKFTYTRDGEKDIPVIKGSNFNVIVTNTGKIRLRKEQVLKRSLGGRQLALDEDRAKELVANLRLQTITSLPDLAVFSDEAHHLFGRRLDRELKRVRQTINYINQNTNLKVVINTTGTPYYKRQLLRDVVYWYGLSQGINDGILKEVRNNIVAYSKVTNEDFLKDVVSDFFDNYRDVQIYDGSPAKIAIYFPKIKDLKEAKPVVEQVLISKGLDPSVALSVHSKSPQESQDLFDNRVNDPNIPYRVFLLVNKGTEGWNCLSLFATALARKLRSSNNFVLQAATRCLRQTKGNTERAKIYLSKDNVSILDKQLRETYGETLEDLNQAETEKEKVIIKLRKTEIEPLKIKKIVTRFVPEDKEAVKKLTFNKPKTGEIKEAEKTVYTLRETKHKVLIATDKRKLERRNLGIDIYQAAVELAEIYRADSLLLFNKLSNLYSDGEIPLPEWKALRLQIEKQVSNYKPVEETIEEVLAIVRKDGFEKGETDGTKNYYAELKIKKDRLNDYILNLEDHKQKGGQLTFGFHYNPYNFDSIDERNFFETLLTHLGEDPDDIEDIYYTGAITDAQKTDFVFEVQDKNGEWHPYTPDFLIRKKNGKSLIVEVKGKPYYDKKAKSAKDMMKRLERINKEKLKYELLLLDKDDSIINKINPVKDWIYKQK